jgi:hypothetical protein
MSTYKTTYSAGVSRMGGEPEPADAPPPEGHPSAADKPIEERVPWPIPPSGDGLPLPPAEDPAAVTDEVVVEAADA